MSLLFFDGFDHYTTADIPSKWSSASGASINPATGRRASASARFTSYSHYLSLGFGAVTQSALVVGMAVRLTNLGYNLFGLQTGSQYPHMMVAISSTGELQALLGHGYPWNNLGPVLVTSDTHIPPNAYVFVEAKIVIHPTAGSVVLRLNEVEVANISGVPTSDYSGAAGTGYNQLVTGIYLVSGSTVLDIDDVYVLDVTGPAPYNDFLGDVRVDVRRPTAEGAHSEWTPSSGTDNSLLVKDVTPDGDSTYVLTGGVGVRDTHIVQDVAVPGAQLFGVQLLTNVKKMDAGTCTVAPIVRTPDGVGGFIDYVGDIGTPNTSYGYQRCVYPTNPRTGLPWTEEDFNASEFGYQRLS